MTTTQERPVISDEEFDEDATVRLSDLNALKEMFHELKDKFESLKMEKTIEAMAQKSGDGSDQVTSLQCFNSKDMIKPDQYDMEVTSPSKRPALCVQNLSCTLHNTTFWLKVSQCAFHSIHMSSMMLCV